MLEKIGRSAPFYYGFVGLAVSTLIILGLYLHVGGAPLRFLRDLGSGFSLLLIVVMIPGLILLGHLVAQLELLFRHCTALKYSSYSVYGACASLLYQVDEGKEELRQLARRVLSVPSELQGIYTEREESRELAHWIRSRDRAFSGHGETSPGRLDGWAQFFRILFFCLVLSELVLLAQWLFYFESFQWVAVYFLLSRLILLSLCYQRAAHYSRLYVQAVLSLEAYRMGELGNEQHEGSNAGLAGA
ncbi:MAG: hypothetical protein RI565_08380 [Schleiferiaceae bacterium]|nr:hypothetical protein [Schleiferiaceae bacterium]